MQYIIIIIPLLLSIAAFVAILIWLYNFKLQTIHHLIFQAFGDVAGYSEILSFALAKFIIHSSAKSRNKLLNTVKKAQSRTLLADIPDSPLRYQMQLMLNSKPNSRYAGDSLYNLLLAEFYLNQNNYDKAFEVFQSLKSKLPPLLSALRSRITSILALSEGDLQTSIDDASAAVKIFQSKGFTYEEAKTYFLLGTIYRVSGIFDTAEFILREAEKLFKACGSKIRVAETLASLGMLTALQKRFDEADSWFKQALQQLDNDNHPTVIFIRAQQAILELLRNNPSEAAKQAQQLKKTNLPQAADALVEDILARTAYAQSNWSQLIKHAASAVECYRQQHNYAAEYECRYLQAEGYANLGKNDIAETLLRDLIHDETSCHSCFHIASAYTLLGLILLRRNQFAQARTIFNQALNHELSDNRGLGVAIDYMNLASLEQQCGNTAAANKNLEAALAYSEAFDPELYSKIKATLH